MAEKEKSAWDRFKDGFKPASVRADENIAEKNRTMTNQYEQDRQAGSENVRKKFVKGFFGN